MSNTDYLEHARTEASAAQMTDDPALSTTHAANAVIYATLAQAEALDRIADSLEKLAKTATQHNGSAYLDVMLRGR